MNEYKTKTSPFKRITLLLIGTLLLIIDVGIVYILYTAAVWLTALVTAPAVVTILLTILGVLFFGSIIMILLISGLVSLYMGIVG